MFFIFTLSSSSWRIEVSCSLTPQGGAEVHGLRDIKNSFFNTARAWGLIRTDSTNKKTTRRWFYYWWRRRESNPRPQILCHRIYMLSRIFNLTQCYPTGREDNERSRLSFNESTSDEFHRGLVRVDAWFHRAQAQQWADGTMTGY